jgi:hypothetical protein
MRILGNLRPIRDRKARLLRSSEIVSKRFLTFSDRSQLDINTFRQSRLTCTTGIIFRPRKILIRYDFGALTSQGNFRGQLIGLDKRRLHIWIVHSVWIPSETKSKVEHGDQAYGLQKFFLDLTIPIVLWYRQSYFQHRVPGFLAFPKHTHGRIAASDNKLHSRQRYRTQLRVRPLLGCGFHAHRCTSSFSAAPCCSSRPPRRCSSPGC